jgi:hypothetical protein
MNTSIKNNNTSNVILSILILSLFVHLRYETPLVIIRPFDLLCIIVFPFIILIKNSEDGKNNSGLSYLIPFFFIHAFSALTVGADNFIRESLQIIVILFFAIILSKFKTRVQYKETINYLFLGALIITVGTMFWHLEKGYWVGWKQLHDTRIIFTIITILTFLFITFFEKYKKKHILILLFILLPILIMSGERKALIIFLILFLVRYSPGISIKTIFILFMMYLLFNILNTFIENAYINNKISTMLNILQTGNVNYFFSTGQINQNDTFSNLQRAFSFQVSKEYFLENPFLGIGTNKYVILVNEQYYNLPKFMKLGIHGEFQRVLVENGLVGIIAYLYIWYKSWTRTKIVLFEAQKNGLINKEQLNFLLYSIYLTFAFYVGTEASSTRSFLLLVIISLLPDYISHNFSKIRIKIEK